MLNQTKRWVLAGLLLVSIDALASGSTSLVDLQHDWAHVQYELEGDAQIEAFEALIKVANRSVQETPDSPEIAIWAAIIKSSYAGKASMLRAGGLVKEARKHLEWVVNKAPETMDGSALTSLGALYYQVPGWPLSFGNKKEARKYLEKALTLNPDGIDSNYFYGDFLAQQGETDEALKVLKKAKAAASRPGRPVADEGRHQEIDALIKKLES